MTDVAEQVANAVLDGMKRQHGNFYPDWVRRGESGDPLLSQLDIAGRFRELPDGTQEIIRANVLNQAPKM